MSEGAFEAKLTAKRETAAGIYLTIQVQPNDYGADLATLRVGSHLMLGWSEIVDTSVEPIEVDSAVLRTEAEKAPEDGGDTTSSGATIDYVSERVFEGKRPIPPGRAEALRAAYRTAERRKFSELPLSQQAGIRAGDESFRTFIDADTEEMAAAKIRLACGVDSRSELNTCVDAGARWESLESHYQEWLTDNRYAESRRG